MIVDPPVPVTWHALADEHTPTVAAMLQRHIRLSDRLAGLEGRGLTDEYAGSDSTLARGCLFCGTAAIRDVVAKYYPFLVRVLGTLDAMNRRDSVVTQHLVNFALIAEFTGTPRPAGVGADRMKPLAAKRKEHFDAARRSMAFTSLALGDTATALAFLDARPASYDEPRLEFEFNIYELIRYLAAALDQRRPADWIEPAWLEYLETFPLHLAAEAAEWPDIFMFARVLAELRGDRISDIADDLHARVQRLAQQRQ